jgi:PAS domain S-box-containing protein
MVEIHGHGRRDEARRDKELADDALREALRRSEATLSAIIERLPVAVAVLDADGRVTMFNDATVRLHGAASREAMKAEFERYRELFELTDLDGRPLPENEWPFRRALRGEDVHDLDLRLRRKGSEGRIVEFAAAPVRSTEGLESVAFVLHDVTEHGRERDALRESEERYRLINRASNDVIWDWDLVTGTMYWNESLERVFGYDPAQIPPTLDWWTEHVHPDQRESAEAGLLAVIESGGENWHDEYRFLKADGTYAMVFDRGYVYRRGGRAIRMVGSMLDMTERLQAEQALRESESFYRQTLESIPGMSFTMTPEGGTDYVSEQWIEFTGMPTAEFLGNAWLRSLHPDDRDNVLHAWREAVEDRAGYDTEYRVRRHDGVYEWFKARARAIRDEHGRIVRWFGTAMNVNDLKEAEHELRLHREHLQQLVEQRTAELDASQERLRLSERMASIGTLAAGLGHDMANLLLPVRVRLESLEAMGLPEPAMREIERIRASAEYLRKLSAGLRLLSVDPNTPANAESTHLESWWSESEPVVRNALPRGVQLVSDLAPCHDAPVAMSKAALTQVVFNIVQNSADAMRGSGAGTVSVSASCEDSTVRLEIADTGPGMTEEVRRRCMDPFFTTKPRGISTGLGLTLVYGLVRDAGGSIELDSAPGRGTRFALRLPLRQPTGASQERRRRRAWVDLRDARVRGYVKAELEHLDWEVRLGAAESAEDEDLVVVDAPTAPAQRGRVVKIEADARLSEIRSSLGARLRPAR